MWARTHSDDVAAARGMAAVCLISNFTSVLGHDVYIVASNYKADVDNFAKAVVERLLANLPNSVESLRDAFRAGEMCGKPLRYFGGWEEKATALMHLVSDGV